MSDSGNGILDVKLDDNGLHVIMADDSEDMFSTSELYQAANPSNVTNQRPSKAVEEESMDTSASSSKEVQHEANISGQEDDRVNYESDGSSGDENSSGDAGGDASQASSSKSNSASVIARTNARGGKKSTGKQNSCASGNSKTSSDKNNNKRSDPHTVAEKAIRRILGCPDNLTKFKCKYAHSKLNITKYCLINLHMLYPQQFVFRKL